MNLFISDQIFELAVMIYAGMITVFFLDMLKLYNRKSKAVKKISVIQDILCWIFISLIVVSLLYYCSFGKLSWQILPEYILGMAAYRCLLSKIIMETVENLSSFFYRKMRHNFITSAISACFTKNRDNYKKKCAIMNKKQKQRTNKNEEKAKRRKFLKRSASKKNKKKDQQN